MVADSKLVVNRTAVIQSSYLCQRNILRYVLLEMPVNLKPEHNNSLRNARPVRRDDIELLQRKLSL
jgi:hypothetical protein